MIEALRIARDEARDQLVAAIAYRSADTSTFEKLYTAICGALATAEALFEEETEE